MSKYSEVKTNFTNPTILLEALAEMGFTADKVQVSETPQQLYDYQDRKTHYIMKDGDKAEIRIDRRYVGGAANDLGFYKTANGSYSAIISAYDSSTYNAQWLGKLKAHYAEKNTMLVARQRGLRFAGRTTNNGKVQLQFVKI